jgi:hypothetical protein
MHVQRRCCCRATVISRCLLGPWCLPWCLACVCGSSLCSTDMCSWGGVDCCVSCVGVQGCVESKQTTGCSLQPVVAPGTFGLRVYVDPKSIVLDSKFLGGGGVLNSASSSGTQSYACSLVHSDLSWWRLKSSMHSHVAHMHLCSDYSVTLLCQQRHRAGTNAFMVYNGCTATSTGSRKLCSGHSTWVLPGNVRTV